MQDLPNQGGVEIALQKQSRNIKGCCVIKYMCTVNSDNLLRKAIVILLCMNVVLW
jgi:hypothetical protein